MLDYLLHVISPIAVHIPMVGNWLRGRGPFLKPIHISTDHNHFPIPYTIRTHSHGDPLDINTIFRPTRRDDPPLLFAIPTYAPVILPAKPVDPTSYPQFLIHGNSTETMLLGGVYTVKDGDHMTGILAIHSYLVDLHANQTFWIDRIDGLTTNGMVELSGWNMGGDLCLVYVPSHRFILPWYWRWVRLRNWYQGGGYLDDTLQQGPGTELANIAPHRGSFRS